MTNYLVTAVPGGGAYFDQLAPGDTVKVAMPAAFETLTVVPNGGVSAIEVDPLIKTVPGAPAKASNAAAFVSSTYSGPAGAPITLLYTGPPSITVFSWNPTANPGNASSGFNVDTFTVWLGLQSFTAVGGAGKLGPGTKVLEIHPKAPSKGISPLLVVGGVAGLGVGGMLLAGILTDNGPGWLFGLAASEALEASEAMGRRFRRAASRR